MNIFKRRKNGVLDEKPDLLLYEYASICGASDEDVIPDEYILPSERIPDCRNQKWTGQCVAFTGTNIIQILNQIETGERVQFSTTYAYGRHRNEYQREVQGMNPFSFVKHLCLLGSVPHDEMPKLVDVPEAYDLVHNHPSLDKLDEIASKTKIKTYIGFVSADSRKRNTEIKRALLRYKIPLFGNIKMGGGYHAVSIIGWDKNNFYYMNSWGEKSGKKGICSCSYDDLKYAILLLDEKNSPDFPFNDVPDEHWASKSIRRCFGAGFINGISEKEFSPEGVLTRAQVCQAIYKMAQKLTEAEGEKFKGSSLTVLLDDVNPMHWYYDAVRYCLGAGIVLQKSENKFDSDEALTRAEFCFAISRFIKMFCSNKKMLEPDLIDIPFNDVDAKYMYYDAIQLCYSLGIINGVTETEFRPNDSLNRAQMCQMIYKFIKLMERREA